MSFFSGTDTNGDFVFAQVIENNVPEPASMAVLGVGMLGLGLIRRRRA